MVGTHSVMSVHNEADAYLQRKRQEGRRVIQELQNMPFQFFREKKSLPVVIKIWLQAGKTFSCEGGEERGQTNGALLPCQCFEIPGFTQTQFCSGPNCEDNRTVD